MIERISYEQNNFIKGVVGKIGVREKEKERKREKERVEKGEKEINNSRKCSILSSDITIMLCVRM